MATVAATLKKYIEKKRAETNGKVGKPAEVTSGAIADPTKKGVGTNGGK
jgi:hypothetical protein